MSGPGQEHPDEPRLDESRPRPAGSGSPGLACGDERRRRAVRAAGKANGLDYIEVSPDQRHLSAYFLAKAPAAITPANVRITGGRRVRGIRVTGVSVCRSADPERDDCLEVTVDRPGDFSTYRLCLVEADALGRPGGPLAGFDPRYACLDFSFKVDCAADLDCAQEAPCAAPELPEPAIDYLAKDYASFVRLLYDRLALTVPGWQERHVPDLGVTLVELLAYAGDALSYYQDAVATEAYLGTARQRISVRRHARLVDYRLHEGCNARSWVQIATDTQTGAMKPPLTAADLFFVTAFPGAPAGRWTLAEKELAGAPAGSYVVFEPLVRDPAAVLRLRPAHNRITIYTWGDADCCLPRGATRATLVDAWLPPAPPATPAGPAAPAGTAFGTAPAGTAAGTALAAPAALAAASPSPPPEQERALDLARGDYLLFEEVLGPATGNPADADPEHRHVVRLTRVDKGIDPLFAQPVLEVEWAAADALPFALCLSALGPAPDCLRLADVSVARANLLLADHGRTVDGETLPQVPGDDAVPCCLGEGRPAEVVASAARYRTGLGRAPLTFSAPPAWKGPASRLLDQDPRRAEPRVAVGGSSRAGDPLGTGEGVGDGGNAGEGAAAPLPWLARPDLLAAGPADPCFTVEIDDDGGAHLRFGDGTCGMAPEPGTLFTASYRFGNGPDGNLGAGALRFCVLRRTISGLSLRPRNPLPARGGTAPEPVAEARLTAPTAIRRLRERAVTADDYARLVESGFPGRVRAAAATLRWTGSRYEVLVAVDTGQEEPADPQEEEDGAEPAGEELRREIRRYLERFRRIGHEVKVEWAEPVALAVGLYVCVLPHALRGQVRAALLAALGNQPLAGGRTGFFAAANLGLGQPVDVSRLVAAAQAVPGVESVAVARLERLGEGPAGELEQGYLALAPLEMARLDNDPRWPANGKLDLALRGGR
jgi:hypothetical protein